ncbi:MAG: hypothetical protein HY717_03280 [Planctomycetes bacterium]|nr:hypothetical protein [Planctomycetota bacterium]
MRKCYKCGTSWVGAGDPRPRQVCEGCGAYLHSCINCHQFDAHITNSCKLSHTTFVGSRHAANYCDEFRMINYALRSIEARTQRARSVWEQLFQK